MLEKMHYNKGLECMRNNYVIKAKQQKERISQQLRKHSAHFLYFVTFKGIIIFIRYTSI